MERRIKDEKIQLLEGIARQSPNRYHWELKESLEGEIYKMTNGTSSYKFRVPIIRILTAVNNGYAKLD